MWTGYTTRQAADFVGLPESAVRSCARAGFLAPSAEPVVPLRFTFRDMKVLKLVKLLTTKGLSLRKVRRQLGELQRRLPSETSLSEMTITSSGGQVLVRNDQCAWHADTGQLVFEFSVSPPEGDVTPIQPKRKAAAPEPVKTMSADDWFARALELEEDSPEAAIDAYKKVLKYRPACVETLINMGRLYAESGEPAQAAESFTMALSHDPTDATALYNLGVLAQDAGQDQHAITLYRRALVQDRQLAEAHYNLATVYDRTGDAHAAIRHINEYRKLTKNLE